MSRFLKLAMLVLCVLYLISCKKGIEHPDTFAFVHSFLQATYPEIPPNASLQISIKSQFSDVPKVVGDINCRVFSPFAGEKFGSIPGTPPPVMPPDVLLEAGFVGDIYGGLAQVSIGGYLSDSKKWEGILTLLDSHPQWSDSQAIQALEQAGARFGPDRKSAFLHQIPLEAIGRTLNESLTLDSVEFHGADEPHVGSFANMVWTTKFRGKTRSYVANFEPFGGHLILLMKYPL